MTKPETIVFQSASVADFHTFMWRIKFQTLIALMISIYTMLSLSIITLSHELEKDKAMKSLPIGKLIVPFPAAEKAPSESQPVAIEFTTNFTFPSPTQRLKYYMGDWYERSVDPGNKNILCNEIVAVDKIVSDKPVLWRASRMKYEIGHNKEKNWLIGSQIAVKRFARTQGFCFILETFILIAQSYQ